MAQPKRSKVTRLPTAAAAPQRVAAALQRCPEHGWVVMPIFSLRPCCLVAALQRIERDGGEAGRLANEALQPRDKRIKRVPKLGVRSC